MIEIIEIGFAKGIGHKRNTLREYNLDEK